MTTKRKEARAPLSARLAAAAEFSRSPDPFVRRRGLEMAAPLGRSASDILWNGLLDSDPTVRERAIQLAAAKLPGGRLLDGVASEGNSVLRTACIEAMKQKGAAALPALKKGIASRDEDVVLFSVQILGSMPAEEVVPLLAPFLKHENLNIAQAAIDSLGQLRSPQAVEPLLELLGGDLWLRFAAVLALGRIGDSRATLDLLGLIEDESLGGTALEAVGSIGDPSAVRPLCSALVKDDRYPQRDAILIALDNCLRRTERIEGLEPGVKAQLADESFHRYLRQAVQSTNAALRSAANRFVRALGHEPFYAGLVDHVDDEALANETVSFFAALTEAAGARAIVTAALQHERPSVRAAALRILGMRSEAWVDPLVTECLADPDPNVLASAVRALARKRPADVFGKVLPLLFHGSEAVRTRALEALPSLATPDDIESVRKELAAASDPERLAAYVELSRRLERSRFVDVWLARLDGAPTEVLRVLLRALGEANDPRVRKTLLPFLDHPSSAIRTLAIEALSHGTFGENVGPEFHRRLLTDSDCTYYLVRALGRLRYTPAADDLESLYVSAAPLEKVALLEALGAMETPSAGRFLKIELESKDRERRRAAATALARHFREGNFGLFAKLARSDDWALRNTAAWALGEMRQASAREVLGRLAEDPEEVVARTAKSALEKLPT